MKLLTEVSFGLTEHLKGMLTYPETNIGQKSLIASSPRGKGGTQGSVEQKAHLQLWKNTVPAQTTLKQGGSRKSLAFLLLSDLWAFHQLLN